MASNIVFTAEKTEIGERESFSIRRTGWDTWDASLPWHTLSDCTMTLSNAFSAPGGSVTRGIAYQVTNVAGNYRPQSKLQWLDTDGQEYILLIHTDELPLLASALTDLASEVGQPLDLDVSQLSRRSFDENTYKALSSQSPDGNDSIISQAMTDALNDPSSELSAQLNAKFVTHYAGDFDGRDETAKFQAAVTEAAGGVIVIPRGRAVKTQKITVPAAGLTVRMEQGAVIDFIDPGAVGGVICLFLAEDVAFFEVEGGKIEASNATGRTSVHGLLRVKNVPWFRAQNLKIGKSSSTGIHTWNVAEFLIDDISIVGTYADGIHLSRGTSNGSVSRVRGWDTGDDLVAINSYTPTGSDTFGPCTNITISDIKGWNIGNGQNAGRCVAVNGGVDVTVDKVFADGVSQAAVVVSRDSGMFDPENVHVRGVIAHNTGAVVSPGSTSGAVYIAHLTKGTVKDLSGSDRLVSVAPTASEVEVGDRPRFFVPTTRMMLATGSPAHNASSSHRVPVWLFDAASDESISLLLDAATELKDWTTMRVALVWANAGAGAGDVSWRLYGAPVAVGGALAPAAQIDGLTVTAGAEGVVTQTVLASSVAVPSAGQLAAFRIYRVATAGGDTLANDVAVLGLILTRMT